MPSQSNSHEQPTTASYERVSTTSQARYGYSLAAQNQGMGEFAEAHGWDLPDHLQFQDTGSGADWDLPGLNAMLEAARNGEFEILIVPDLDRLARSMVKALVLEEQLSKYGVRVVYQRVPVEDSPEGRLLRNQLHGFAEYDREKRRLASMMGKLRKAQEGKIVGGLRPRYGYQFVQEEARGGNLRTIGLKLDPLTAPVVARAFELARHHSTGEIAGIFNADGIPAPSGGRWFHKTVWRILASPVYTGVWSYGDVDVDVEPIVDRDTWQKTQEILRGRDHRHRPRTPKDEDPYLLRGVLKCGHCGTTLYCRPNRHIRYYQCGHSYPSRAKKMGWHLCDLPDLHAESLEAELWELLTATLLDPDYLHEGLASAGEVYEQSEHMRIDRMKAVGREIARHRQRLQKMAGRLDEMEDGEFYDVALKQAKDIETLIAGLVRQRAELDRQPSEGLSPEAIEDIEDFVALMVTGVDDATAVDRRRLYELFEISGIVYADKNGVLLGRKHRFRIDWDAAIPLRHDAASTFTVALPVEYGMVLFPMQIRSC